MSIDFDELMRWGEKMLQFHRVSATMENLRAKLHEVVEEQATYYEQKVITPREYFNRVTELFVAWMRPGFYESHHWLELDLHHILMGEGQPFARWLKYSPGIDVKNVSLAEIKNWLVLNLELGPELSKTEGAGILISSYHYKREDGQKVNLDLAETIDNYILARVEFQPSDLLFDEKIQEFRWREYAYLPWSSDVEFGRALQRDLKCEVICNPGELRSKSSLDISEMWQISMDGERMIHRELSQLKPIIR